LSAFSWSSVAGVFTSSPAGATLGEVAGQSGPIVLVTSIAIVLAELFASQRNAGDITTFTSVVGGIATLVVTVLVVGGATGPVGWVAAAIVAVAIALFAVFSVQDYAKHIFTFYPSMWQAPSDGYNCGACNRLQLAGEGICSEYTCHSYGLAC